MTAPDLDALIAELHEAAGTFAVCHSWHGYDPMQPKDTLYGRAAAALEASQREVALWMIARSYATGHGDTVEDMLNELEAQVRERMAERLLEARK